MKPKAVILLNSDKRFSTWPIKRDITLRYSQYRTGLQAYSPEISIIAVHVTVHILCVHPVCLYHQIKFMCTECLHFIHRQHLEIMMECVLINIVSKWQWKVVRPFLLSKYLLTIHKQVTSSSVKRGQPKTYIYQAFNRKQKGKTRSMNNRKYNCHAIENLW